jgi:hypothetical protein
MYPQQEKMFDYLNSITTNTKVRRLGYFKLLSEYLSSEKSVGVGVINRSFEDFCQQYTNHLINYKNSKGLISKTVKGTSAKPYINIAVSLGLLNLIGNQYYQGKVFKVYGVLKRSFQDNTDNYFVLSSFDRCFFLERILFSDYLYIKAILEFLNKSPVTTYNEMLTKFQRRLIAAIIEFRNDISLHKQHGKIQRKAGDLIERIRSWRKPEIYLEHVLMPRINWLYDLEIINFEKEEISLTSYGKNLINSLENLHSENIKRNISLSHVLENSMMYLCSATYENTKVLLKKKIDSVLSEVIDKMIEDSFVHFKTLAPNRVTLSQAINYTRYRLYFEQEQGIEFNIIVNYLSGSGQKKFIYKYQSQFGDGYLQLK